MRAALALCLLVMASVPSAASARDPGDGARKKPAPAIDWLAPYTLQFRVTFFHVHTRELLPVGTFVDRARAERFLRCRVTGRTHVMAARPLEVAIELAVAHGARRVEVLSGYRSEKFNELLRKKGHEVAQRSRHVLGDALDFRIDGVTPEQLAREVSEVHAGGVGIYRESGFVHVDVGPPRRWGGR